MQVHVLGIPHVPVTPQESRCAFTAKAVRLCQMLRATGHKVILYGVEGSDATLADEFVAVVPRAIWQGEYGHMDTAKRQFAFNESGPVYAEFNRRAPYEILRRVSYQDAEAVLCCFGKGHEEATKRLPWNVAVVEPGVGYTTTFSPYRVFESYAWMHYMYGRQQQGSGAGMAYDAVIPQAFDLSFFTFNGKPQGYWLFMGRVNDDKGWRIAADACARMREPLLVVGQIGQGAYGDKALADLYDMKHVVFLPSVGPKERDTLMGGAKGLFALTQYIEPFGGVAVEAQLCGTPVLASDWGAFTETVLHGETGWRCRTMDDILWGMAHIGQVRRATCREWAEANYSTERIAQKYDEYFWRLASVIKGKGFYELRADRHDLDWLRTSHPSTELKAAAEANPGPPPSFERQYWDNPANVVHEQAKQRRYAEELRIPIHDLGGRSVVDIGGGPCSLLLQCRNVGRGVVVDPMPLSEAEADRYRKAGVTYLQVRAEDFAPSGESYDEVWMMNVLQHVGDPAVVLRKVGQMAQLVRIFEWLDQDAREGHCATLPEEAFRAALADYTIRAFQDDLLVGKAIVAVSEGSAHSGSTSRQDCQPPTAESGPCTHQACERSEVAPSTESERPASTTETPLPESRAQRENPRSACRGTHHAH